MRDDSPVEESMDILVYNANLIEALATKLSLELKREITQSHICNALFMLWGDRFQLEWMVGLWDIRLDEEEVTIELKKFDFSVFDNVIVSDHSVIQDIVLYEKKALVKAAGDIWIIHLNDPDPFPSSPHAHQIEENIKLDLSNGNCYRVKKYLKTISRKDLLKIREQAEKRFKGKLPVLEV